MFKYLDILFNVSYSKSLFKCNKYNTFFQNLKKCVANISFYFFLIVTPDDKIVNSYLNARYLSLLHLHCRKYLYLDM